MTTPTVDLNQWSATAVMDWEKHWHSRKSDWYILAGTENQLIKRVSDWSPLTNSDQAKQVAQKVVEKVGEGGYINALIRGLDIAADPDDTIDYPIMWKVINASNEAILQACYLVYGQEGQK